jgi:hypothetical protein
VIETPNTLSVGDTLATARRQLERGWIRHLPVVDGDERVIGAQFMREGHGEDGPETGQSAGTTNAMRRIMTTTRTMLTAALLTTLAGGGFALAQAPTTSPSDHAAHHPAATTAPAPKGQPAPKAAPTPAPEHAGHGGGMMGGGMMGGGMMGGGMMGGGMCPMMGGAPMGDATTKVDVKKLDKGVTITLTSPDPATVTRLQKMAEGMRLMHEATAK